MDLDEIDPAQWALLDAATDEYIAREDSRLDELSRLLMHNLVQDGTLDVSQLRLGVGLLMGPLGVRQGSGETEGLGRGGGWEGLQ